MQSQDRQENRCTALGKQKQVVEQLRLQIVTGEYRPGTRIPTHVDLVKQFRVSPVTIQQAMNELIQDGFLCTQPRQGTFVVEEPPHLGHYGVLFHTIPSDATTWQQFWVALSNEAIALQSSTKYRLSLFYGIHGWEKGADYERLLDLVRRHQLAGLIFTSDPHSLEGGPLLCEPDIPRVGICNPRTQLTSIQLDGMSNEIIRLLLARKRRRVGFIVLTGYPRASIDNLFSAFAENGFEVRPEWMQAAALHSTEWARNVAQMMMSIAPDRRPDAVVILDDNLVPDATAGIAASGVSVPDEVDVVAHTNFPWPTHSAVPVHRVGYDAREILHACIDVINSKRAGSEPPEVVKINPISQPLPQTIVQSVTSTV